MSQYIFATGAACQQRTLTPLDTLSCPTLGLACVLMLRSVSPELVLFPDFPLYFCFALIYCFYNQKCLCVAFLWVFGGIFYVVTLLFRFFYGCRGVCHRTESDLFLFLSTWVGCFSSVSIRKIIFFNVCPFDFTAFAVCGKVGIP